jgi:hypothetical protein
MCKQVNPYSLKYSKWLQYWWAFSFEALTVVMLWFFYHPPSFDTKHSEDHKTKWELIKELDYVGLFLFTGSCLILLIALNWVSAAEEESVIVDLT